MGEIKGAFNEGFGKGLGYALGGIFFLLLILVLGYAGIKLGGVTPSWMAATQSQTDPQKAK